MKLAFSTLGCPDWTWSEIYATATDLKFDGIELRGIANELYVPSAKRFSPEKLPSTIEKLKAGNVKISMLTTGIAVGELSVYPRQQVEEYINLASKLSCNFIRIMISSQPQPSEVDMEKAIDFYNQLCVYGEDKGVTPLIETNGILADSLKMKEFMGNIQSANKGVLWDVHHPYRFFGEAPSETFHNIGEYVKYAHVKDSVMKDDKITYRMMGYGDVPIYDTLRLLKQNGYDSYISLEWVKRWNPDLEDAGIVFAHFMSYITFLLSRI